MRSLKVGHVVGRAFGIMVRNPVVAFGVPLLLSALPLALFNHAFALLLLDIQDRQKRLPAFRINPHGLLEQFSAETWAVISFIISLFLGAVMQGCLVRATVADSEGRQAGLGECLWVAATRALPLVATSILFLLGLLTGLVSLIVPGVLFAIAYAPVTSVVVEEGVGVFGAFKRVDALTQGARGKIFGLALLVLTLIWLLKAILGKVAILLFHRSYDPFSPLLILFNILVGTIVATLGSTVPTALYVELRERKEGPHDGKLSEIFE